MSSRTSWAPKILVNAGCLEKMLRYYSEYGILEYSVTSVRKFTAYS